MVSQTAEERLRALATMVDMSNTGAELPAPVRAYARRCLVELDKPSNAQADYDRGVQAALKVATDYIADEEPTCSHARDVKTRIAELLGKD